MKKMWSLLLVILLGLTARAQQYRWVDISANIPDFPFDTTIINNGQDTIIANLSDVFFINDNEGWITTYHPFNDTAAILHTTDGGATFSVQTTTRACHAIRMLNANEGFAGGQNGFLYKTTNGGADWNFYGTITNTLTDISFPTQPSDTGYACGLNGAVWRITSTGVTNLNSGLGNTFNGISSPTSEKAWACGSVYIYLYDGNSFVEQPSPSGTFSEIWMLNERLGWVAGDDADESGLIAATPDGDNWVVQSFAPSTLYDVFALDPNHVWAVGFDGVIMHTTNGADFGFDTTTSTGWSNVIWNQEAIGLTQEFLGGVKFTSPTNGYVTGNNKTLLKYSLLSNAADEARHSIDWQLFPNPASGTVRVQTLGTKVAAIRIFDIFGSLKMERSVHPALPEMQLDVSGLPNGIYLLELQSLGGTATKKLIIHRN